jgi:hypothetical protein
MRALRSTSSAPNTWTVAVCCALALAALARAEAPPGRYTTTSDTVLDTRTDLVWQRAVDATTRSQADAATYCADLTLDGDSDFRLPTRAELLSIVDRSRYNPSIDTAAFPDTPAEIFWSSTPFAGDSGQAWIVNFHGGYTNPHAAVASAFHARCVR